MAVAGIRAFLEVDDATGVPTDISHYLDGITPSSDTDELDGTTFQPGVAAPTKEIVAGFRTRALSLSAKWTPEAETFFSGIEGLQGLAYAYGPLGNEDGMVSISGVCNCLSWTGPVSTVDGITTATAELRCSTRLLGTFQGGVATPADKATGATSGTPGSFTPAGAQVPANLAAMTGVTATPGIAWLTGTYVATGDAIHCHWDGSTWITGNAP